MPLDTTSNQPSWDLTIEPKTGWFDINIKEIWQYRGLVLLFIKRDLVTFYKQTILGPLWYIIQPIVNTLIFSVIFGKVARIPTEGMPPFLFYMPGVVAWGYFSHCLMGAANTFTANAGLFGKIYFPRLTVPISILMTGLFHFSIQCLVFLVFYVYFRFAGVAVPFTRMVFVIPLLVLQIMVLSLGVGTLISALTTKYRDLRIAMEFGVQLWMYLTPIAYPFSQIPTQYRTIYALNPMVSVVEMFRSALLGSSVIEMHYVAPGLFTTVCLFIAGVTTFNRVEKRFMDTI